MGWPSSAKAGAVGVSARCAGGSTSVAAPHAKVPQPRDGDPGHASRPESGRRTPAAPPGRRLARDDRAVALAHLLRREAADSAQSPAALAATTSPWSACRACTRRGRQSGSCSAAWPGARLAAAACAAWARRRRPAWPTGVVVLPEHGQLLLGPSAGAPARARRRPVSCARAARSRRQRSPRAPCGRPRRRPARARRHAFLAAEVQQWHGWRSSSGGAAVAVQQQGWRRGGAKEVRRRCGAPRAGRVLACGHGRKPLGPECEKVLHNWRRRRGRGQHGSGHDRKTRRNARACRERPGDHQQTLYQRQQLHHEAHEVFRALVAQVRMLCGGKDTRHARPASYRSKLCLITKMCHFLN